MKRCAQFLLAFSLCICAWGQQPVNLGQPAGTAASLTALAANAGACDATKCLSITTAGMGSATVTVHGTYAGTTINFEFSDDSGTTYYPTQCAETNSNVQESSKALSTNASLAWDCGIYAMTNLNVRLSAISSGTAVVKITPAAAAIEPALTVSGSGTFSTNQSQIAGTNLVADPCQTVAKTPYPVSISSATTVRFAAPVSAKKTYICSILLVASAADNVNIIEGTGGTCGTGTAGVFGGTTAATGPNISANGGFVLGNGSSSVAATTGTNVDMCLITSSTAQLSGHIMYVQQ